MSFYKTTTCFLSTSPSIHPKWFVWFWAIVNTQHILSSSVCIFPLWNIKSPLQATEISPFALYWVPSAKDCAWHTEQARCGTWLCSGWRYSQVDLCEMCLFPSGSGKTWGWACHRMGKTEVTCLTFSSKSEVPALSLPHGGICQPQWDKSVCWSLGQSLMCACLHISSNQSNALPREMLKVCQINLRIS